MSDSKKTTTYFGKQAIDNASTSTLLFIIIAVSLGVYFNALGNQFVYDDYAQIIENYALRDLGNLPRVFVEDVWSFMGGGQSNYYRPLMHTLYMLNFAVFGMNPWGFHLVNILFHAGVSILVFVVSGLMFSKTKLPHPTFLSMVAALLFATHPIHTEAVTWIACLPEVAFTFFYLLSLILYMRAVEDEHIVSLGRYCFSVLFFAFATLFKETAVTLPLLLVIHDYSFSKAGYRPFKYITRYIPYLAVAIFYLVMRMIVLSGFAPLKRHSDLSVYEYFINIFPLFAQYLQKLILPIHQRVFYVFDPISSILTSVGVVGLALTIVFAIGAMIAVRKSKPVFFYLMIIVVPLLPVLYIPALGDNTFTERYLYLPSVGFVLLVAYLVGLLMKIKPVITNGILVVILVVIGLYSTASVARNTVWKNEETLWLDAVKKEPEGATPHSQLGVVYLEQDKLAQAQEEFLAALRINPNYADAYTNLGLLHIKIGNVQKAIEYYEKALRLKPASPETLNNIGVAYMKVGKQEMAAESFQSSLRLNSQQPGVYNNLGDAYEKMGQLDRAIEEYSKALQVQPGNAEAYNHLGIAYAKKGKLDESIMYFQTALQIRPNDAGFHNNIANAYRMKGMLNKADEHRRQAVDLQGGK